MMLGRSGYDKDWCLYCKCAKSAWTEWHRNNETTEETGVNFPMWTTKALAKAALEREQEIQRLRELGKTPNQIDRLCPSIGVKEAPFWLFLPVSRWVFPELHVLLGIGNKIQNNFWDFMLNRVEVMPQELIEKQNLTIMAAIALKKCKEDVDEAIESLNSIIQARK